jgi:cell division FtsZ-interacting protein ZapD
MPSPNATPTPITPPRVPLIDPRTGLIDRAWYLFFLSLNNIATGVVDDVNLGTDSISLIATYDEILRSVNQELQTLPPVVTLPIPDVLTDCCSALVSQMAEMQKQVEALQSQPIIDTAAITAAINKASSAPVTKTADFTVADNETWLINNKSGSTCTVTLPTASAWSGRTLTFKNMQAQTLVSASSNVVPIDSTTAGTAILLAVVGNWATMVSDGTNWVIMQQAANNCLLLE